MKKRRGQADRDLSRKSRYRTRAAVEQFEERVLMSVYTVSSAVDDPVNGTVGDLTLRGEIEESNANPGANGTANTIIFNLPGTGVQAINLQGLLPTITAPLIIDGSTQAGFSGSPLVQIVGSNSKVGGGPGLDFTAANSEAKDLIIDGFTGDGIDVEGGSSLIDGNWIGLNAAGTGAAGNSGAGIFVDSANNTIGGLSSAPNVISGNSVGIVIQGGVATGNTITHNFVGTDASGLKAVGNTSFGIEDQGGKNTIGGSSGNGPIGLGNLVSGNTTGGIALSGSASNTLVVGNFIGTDLTGNAGLANGSYGLSINALQNVTIGGTTTSLANVISGNLGDGIDVTGAATTNIDIYGNRIGVGVDGTSAVGNLQNGISIVSGTTVKVGDSTLLGNAPQFGNIIANNGIVKQLYGVLVTNSKMDSILSNSIYGNGNIGIKLVASNGGVAAPVLTSAISGAGLTRIIGSYSGQPSSTYTIQFFSSPSGNAQGAGDGRNYLLGDLTFTTDSSGNHNFTTQLSTGVPVGDIISATATLGLLTIRDTSQFSVNVPVIKAAVTDLSIATRLPSASPLLDQPYTFTLTVTNNGPDAATGVVATDTIPANSTFVSTTAGTFANGVLTDNIGALASGATQTITLIVKPIATGKFINTDSVTGNELDNDTSNNTDSTTGTVLSDSDLAVFLTANQNPTPIGSQVVLTLTIANNGPSSANGTIATVQLPADYQNAVIGSSSSASGTIDSSNLVTINAGIVPSSSSVTINITATPTVAATEPVMATVKSSQADPNSANNSVTLPVTAANAADLGVSISAATATGRPFALIGEELFYTVTVTNNGPSDATMPTVVDALPAGLTYDPTLSTAGTDGSLVFANGVVTATLNTITAGDVATFTVAVFPTASGQVINTVTVGDPTTDNSVEIDPDLTNNTAAVATLISPADLSVTIDQPGSDTPLTIGTNVTYQVTVTNNGPADATNVMFNDSFGPGATIINTSVGAGSGTYINANLGTLASGASETILIVVQPTLAGYLGVLGDSASVSSDEYDANTNNNSASTTNLVNPVDIDVAVANSFGSQLLGVPLAYNVSVTNNGPDTATNVVFNLSLPGGSTVNSVATALVPFVINATSASTLSGTIASLAPGQTALITIVLTPSAIGTATVTASASPLEIDTNTDNNTASASTLVYNLAGTFQVASSLVSVAENAGSVILTVDRLQGSSGIATINYATSNGSAISGVNYTGVSGTLTFADGQTSATVTIPILDDHAINGTNSFLFALSSPGDGALLGSPSSTTVAVTNTDRDTVPPTVSALNAITNGKSIQAFRITFDEPMDAFRASQTGNYHIILTNGSTAGSPVGIATAFYDSTSNSVILIPTSTLPNNRFYRIVVNGSVGLALTDTSGNVLTGTAGPNSNYDVSYGQGTNLSYTDSQNNRVTIQLSGGGSLSIFRAQNGNANSVNLNGIVPHKSKLTGSVKKLAKSSSGHTTIGVITGFQKFGYVYSTLTTPSFYVFSSTVTAASIDVPTTVSIESASPAVTISKATPKATSF